MIDYKIKAIPTPYGGISYRSRLEAQWACYFDYLGWRHQYEPFDLEGWTPDFEIFTERKRRLLVEVKPADMSTSPGQYLPAFQKASNHIQQFDLLLVGVQPFFVKSPDAYAIGCLIRLDTWGGDGPSHEPAFLKSETGMGGKWDISHYYGDWSGSIHKRGGLEKKFCGKKFSDVMSIWGGACN